MGYFILSMHALHCGDALRSEMLLQVIQSGTYTLFVVFL